MTSLNEEGRPRQGGQTSTSERVNGTPIPLGWHVIADAVLVTARTGRTRYLLVYRCCCGARHQSQARQLFEAVRRTTACGERVILHPTLERRAAA